MDLENAYTGGNKLIVNQKCLYIDDDDEIQTLYQHKFLEFQKFQLKNQRVKTEIEMTDLEDLFDGALTIETQNINNIENIDSSSGMNG